MNPERMLVCILVLGLALYGLGILSLVCWWMVVVCLLALAGVAGYVVWRVLK